MHLINTNFIYGKDMLRRGDIFSEASIHGRRVIS